MAEPVAEAGTEVGVLVELFVVAAVILLGGLFTVVQALIHAESIEPHHVRNNVFVRQVVADLLRQARRAASGRELRGWRAHGVAPVG